MEQLIWQCFIEYGWVLALISVGGILLLGILKFFKLFDKVTKDHQKYIYTGIIIVYSLISSLIYHLVLKNLEVQIYFTTAGVIYAINQGAYLLYENFGIRKVVQLLGQVFIRVVNHFKAEKVEEKQEDELVGDNLDELEDFTAFETTSLNGNFNGNSTRIE